MITLFDTHAHLSDKVYSGDFEKIIENAKNAGLVKILNICNSANKPGNFIELLKKYDFIYGAAGVHPLEMKGADIEKLMPLLGLGKIVALGEIGLDYHYLYEKNDKEKEIQLQKEFFRAQLKIAKEKNLPVIVHCREAWEDTMKIVEEEKVNNGVFHCFSGGEDELKKCIDFGFYVSFTGPVTYPKSDVLREAVKIAPIEKILIETDCPYLTPQPKRGTRNEPAYVRFTAEKIAQIRGMSLEELSQITHQNACRLFGLKFLKT
ncbi:MAG: TatD family hydrolase [Elusimicrobiota bacterium]